MSGHLYFLCESKFPSGLILFLFFLLLFFCSVGLLMMNFQFLFACISPSILKIFSLNFNSRLAVFFFFFFPFSTVKIVPCLLVCIVSDNKFLLSLFLFPYIFFFSLSQAAFKIFVFIRTCQQCIYDVLWFSSCLFCLGFVDDL